MRYVLESLPVTCAILVLMASVLRFGIATTHEGRIAIVWIGINSVMLMLAQASWWKSYLLDNNLIGTDWSNYVWTVFNTSVMCLYLYAMLVPFRKIKFDHETKS